ncbi:MAG: hypothetical protein ACK4HQ_07680, partial [Brevinematales bacterium]
MERIHFVFGGTEQAKGGGTIIWRVLLSEPYLEVWLHYSSYARDLWSDINHPLLHHVVHEGWGTYERSQSMLPWENARFFDVSKIERGDIVIFDSREVLQQLAFPLKRKGARLFWHVQSKEKVLRKNVFFVPWDIGCYRTLSGLLAISEYVKKRFEGDVCYPLLGKRLPCEILYNGIASSFERIRAKDDYVLYFGRYEGYKNPLFLEKLGFEVRYIGSKSGCSVPVSVPKEKDLGWMRPEEAAQYGDIFVFPSVGEAFGLALVEM